MPLTNGTATCDYSSLTVATHSITAVYSGDSTYNTTTSAAVSQVVNASSTTPDFTIAPSSTASSSQSVPATGGTATYTIEVNPVSGTTFSSDVTLKVTSGLPSGAVASFSKNPVKPGESSVLSVTVAKATASVRSNRMAPFVFALLLMPLLAGRKTRRIPRLFVVVLMLGAIGSIVGIAGCGGGNTGGGTAPTQKTYYIVVTGTSGNLSTTTTVTLIQ